MPDIFHYFPINATREKVYSAIATPQGIDNWWAKESSGIPELGQTYNLFFEPEYYWTAIVSINLPNEAFELTMQNSDSDWEGSKVGFRLLERDERTEVQFYHTGWKADNEHFRISNYCWAMYLRILKRYLEFGELIAYSDRLEV